MLKLDRIRWQCRRGLLELDLVLDGFTREHLANMTSAELELFGRLLNATDNEMWDWISGRADPVDATLADLIERLRAVRCVA
jgi:antitoxin CptB